MKAVKIDASILFLTAMVAILIVGAVGLFFSVRVDPMDTALSGDRIVNTLFVVENGGKPLFSFVLMYYPTTKRAAIFDIPGELGLIIQSLKRVDRIDALYDPENPAAYLKEISNVLGVDIPFSIAYKLADFAKLVDLLEGLEIFIPDPVEYYDVNPKILLPAGTVVLDGGKAVQYSLYELEDEEPSAAIGRRQRVMLSLIKHLGDRYAYISSKPVRALFFSLARTNIDDRSFERLVATLADIDVDKLVIQRVAGNQRDVSGQILLFPFYDGTLIKDIVKQSLSSLVRQDDGWSAERVYTIEVLNGTPMQGVARKTAELLQGFGYEALKVGNADSTDYMKTEIIDRIGDERAAQLFADVIQCENVRTERRAFASDSGSDGGLEADVDFTLIIGKDFNGRFVIP
jgi:anionic cell wall polymer biosynthesis LytR-Cps2A-Psr (LCP) family protein